MNKKRTRFTAVLITVGIAALVCFVYGVSSMVVSIVNGEQQITMGGPEWMHVFGYFVFIAFSASMGVMFWLFYSFLTLPVVFVVMWVYDILIEKYRLTRSLPAYLLISLLATAFAILPSFLIYRMSEVGLFYMTLVAYFFGISSGFFFLQRRYSKFQGKKK